VDFENKGEQTGLSAGDVDFPQVFHNLCGHENGDFIRPFGLFHISTGLLTTAGYISY
jgi:hypothetical protein